MVFQNVNILSSFLAVMTSNTIYVLMIPKFYLQSMIFPQKPQIHISNYPLNTQYFQKNTCPTQSSPSQFTRTPPFPSHRVGLCNVHQIHQQTITILSLQHHFLSSPTLFNSSQHLLPSDSINLQVLQNVSSMRAGSLCLGEVYLHNEEQYEYLTGTQLIFVE